MVPMLPGLCCDRCGHPKLVSGCGCDDLHESIIQAQATVAYDGWPARAVHALKYQGERDRAEAIAAWMQEPLQRLGPVDAILPVPLHAHRERTRGYNQSRCLADALAAQSGIPVLEGLVRTRATETQTHRDRLGRLENMDDAFSIRPGWAPDPGQHYVLIDDVMTTGATLSSCAQVLAEAGATQISVLAFAFDLQSRELKQYREMLRARQ